MNNKISKDLFEKAKKVIPGGVNSPVRSFKSVDCIPVFVKNANGSKVYDEDGNEYIDYIMSWGPLILGHNNVDIYKSVYDVIKKGSSFGLPTRREIDLADLIIECMPNIERIRLTSSGTEACMTAVRLARAYTKKNKIIKFEGCYHGHSDPLLAKAGSGVLTHDILDVNGITGGVSQDTITVEYNDIEKVEKAFINNKDMISSIIVEPVAANMGLVLPQKDFLINLRKLADKYNSVLIFDEVITGFRIGLHGAQGYYNVKPDLTVLGKIIGGGFPVGAVGGKNEIMKLLSPEGNVYHAGTLSGNPVSVAAGISIISKLKDNPHIYDELDEKGKYLESGLNNIIDELKINARIIRLGSLFTLFFTDKMINNLGDLSVMDKNIYARYFKLMLEEAIMFPPSQFEANFISYAHTKKDLDKTLLAAKKVLGEI